MHSYSTNENRNAVYALAALGALAIAWLSHRVAVWVGWPTWLLGSLSFAGVLAAILRAFDQWGWRLEISRQLRLSVTPDLSGRYCGRLISSYKDENDQPVEKQARLTITQTWSRLLVELDVEDQASSSRSIAASLTQSHDGALVRYYYRNRHQPGIADSDMHDHDGAAELTWRSPAGRIDGRYFTMRQTKGTLLLERS